MYGDLYGPVVDPALRYFGEPQATRENRLHSPFEMRNGWKRGRKWARESLPSKRRPSHGNSVVQAVWTRISMLRGMREIFELFLFRGRVYALGILVSQGKDAERLRTCVAIPTSSLPYPPGVRIAMAWRMLAPIAGLCVGKSGRPR